MSSYQIRTNRNKPVPGNRGNRHVLIRKNPPAVLCLICYGIFAGLAIAILLYLKRHRPEFPLWPAFAVLGLSLLWVVIKAIKPRKAKDPVQGLTGYAAIGVVASLLSVGASAALQRSDLSGSEPTVEESTGNQEQGVDDDVQGDGGKGERHDSGIQQPEEETPEDDESTLESNPRKEQTTQPPINEAPAQRPKPETEGASPNAEAFESVFEQPESDDQDESEPDAANGPKMTPRTPIDVTIPSAEPIVLPAGTRLQWERVDANTFHIRLEESPGRFVMGLLKTDIRVETVNGEEISFDVVEAEGRGVALRSSLVMVVDEALPLVQQQTDVPAALNTVLSNSAYGGYRLVTAGASVRTLVDWTSSEDVIRNAFPRLRQSSGNAFSAAVSLSLSELSRRSNRRILVVVTDDVRALADDPTFRRRLANDEVELVIIGPQNPLRNTHPLAESVVGFDELPRLKQRMRSLTIRQEDPGYRIQLIDQPLGIRIRLTIGSGDSAVTAIIPAEAVDESVIGSPSR